MEFFVIRPYRGAALSAGAARMLVDYAQHVRGTQHWGAIGIDAFSGGGESLLLARPATVLRLSLADYALPVLRKYFTD